MTSPRYDLLYLEGGIDQLKDFLLVDELFWPIGVNPPAGESNFPQLTVGGLLLSRERLKARRLPLDQEAKFTNLYSVMQRITTEWQIAWMNKAAREFQMRLNMWRDFIEEYRRDTESNANRYKYEVRLRVMLHLLTHESRDTSPASLDLLVSLDKFLKAVLIHGDFLWENDLMHGFSQDEYWYLYGKLPEEL